MDVAEDGRKLFVGGMDFGTTEENLKKTFLPFGNVIEGGSVAGRLCKVVSHFLAPQMDEEGEEQILLSPFRIGAALSLRIIRAHLLTICAFYVCLFFLSFFLLPFFSPLAWLAWWFRGNEAQRSLFALAAITISDKQTGKPRGIGFVTFETADEAQNAQRSMNGQVEAARVV
jgi:RNA recognition motif-containing protein